MGKPWKVRVTYYVLMGVSLLLAFTPSRLSFQHPMNWWTLGLLTQAYMSFERHERWRRQQELEALMPHFELVLRFRWILAVTKGLPGYLQLKLLWDEIRRTVTQRPQLPRQVTVMIEHIMQSLDDA